MEILYKMSDSVTKYFENQGYSTNHTGETKKDKVVEDVKSLYDKRSKVGVEKYGTTLEDSPQDFYEFLVHLQEELMDATLYIEAIRKRYETKSN